MIKSNLLTPNQKHAFKKSLCDRLGVRGSSYLRGLHVTEDLNEFFNKQFGLVMDRFQPLSSNNVTDLNKYFQLEKALSSDSPAPVFECLSQKLGREFR